MRLIKIILFTLLAYNGYSQNIGIRQVRGLNAKMDSKIDTSKTIGINGVFQKLNSNPSFTVSGGSSSSDTSSNYVSNSGSNANNGYTLTTPKQTIAASQSVVNAKAASAGSAKLYLEAGGIYPEQFTSTANNINISSYNVNDVSVGFKDKGMWPIMSGADVFNSGWTLAGGFSNTYTRSITTTTTEEFSNLGQYSYLNVIAIDTALEKTRPFSARYYLTPVASTALVESTPGSYYTGTSTVSPTTVYIHLPNNSNPNSNTTYRIEVSTRDKAIDAFNGPNSYTTNASYVIERDYMAGYGGFSSGKNSKYDHVIMRNGGGHTSVIAGGTVGNSLVLGGAKGIVSGAIDFYSLSGIGGHNKIFNTIFLNIGGAVGAHTSGGINHGALEINNVFAWPDSTDSQNFVFANNTDTLILNGVYTDHQNNILSNVGVSPNTFIKNSVFVNSVTFGNAPNNFIIDNTLYKAYASGASSASNPSGPSLNTSTKLKITNSIIHLKTYATTAQSQSFLNNAPATSSQRVYSKYNIFIMDAPGGSAGAGVTDNSGTVRDTFDYNIYIKLRGALGFGTTVQGNNLTFAQWQTNSGQDAHSLYIDLTSDANGLKSVFVDPDNGNYNLVQGGWGDSIRVRQAGMLTPPSYFLNKPTQEQAVQMVMDDKIPTIQSLTLTGNTSQQNITTFGNNVNGVNQLIKTDASGKYPALDGSLITNIVPNSTTDFALQNITSATSTVQQSSPFLKWTGQGWKTTATAASQPVTFQANVVPVSGTTAPTGSLIFQSSTNGGGPTNVLTIGSTGNISTAGTITTTNNISGFNITGNTFTGSAGVVSNRNAIAATSTAALNLSNNTLATFAIPVQYSPAIDFLGNAWNGTASNSSNFRIENRPISGTTPITANLIFSAQVQAGGYVDKWKLSNTGAVTLFTSTEPPTPAAGTVVEWWDGTNKKWKKSDGTTGVIY